MKPTLTYYRVRSQTASFHIVAKNHIAWLRRFGVSVIERNTDSDVEDLYRPEPSTPIAIVHTLFHCTLVDHLPFDEFVGLLRRRHQTVLGMEVAESTRISHRLVSWANHPGVDGIMLPSQFSIETFRGSGVTTPIECVPHGVLTARPSSRFDFLGVDDRPKALFFATRPEHRKGWDLLQKLIPEFEECLFVLKGDDAREYFGGAPNILPIAEWLSEEDLASLYRNCDFLVSLHRGGAFEMHCAEAAAYGLPVVATRVGGVADYLDPAWLVDGAGPEDLQIGPDHCGGGVLPDPVRARDVVARLLAGLPEAQRRSGRAARRVRKTLDWERSTRTMLEFASERSRTCA
jgi:glycosyltransferase involved in cell wall biosynthesis